jgi:hypothetical protein
LPPQNRAVPPIQAQGFQLLLFRIETGEEDLVAPDAWRGNSFRQGGFPLGRLFRAKLHRQGLGIRGHAAAFRPSKLRPIRAGIFLADSKAAEEVRTPND